jgi:hypothetical protein
MVKASKRSMSYRSVTEITDCDREISVGGPLRRLDGHTAALSVTRERVEATTLISVLLTVVTLAWLTGVPPISTD